MFWKRSKKGIIKLKKIDASPGQCVTLNSNEIAINKSCPHGMTDDCLECDCIRVSKTIFNLGVSAEDAIKAFSRHVDIIKAEQWSFLDRIVNGKTFNGQNKSDYILTPGKDPLPSIVINSDPYDSRS